MSGAEDNLAAELRWLKIVPPQREYRFAPPRRWRADFAWVSLRVMVEVEGGGFVGGRHTRGRPFENDCEKYNEAALAGWLVLRVTPDQVADGRAIAWIERALARNAQLRADFDRLEGFLDLNRGTDPAELDDMAADWQPAASTPRP